MSTLPSFDRDALVALGRSHASAFAAAQPFPHVVIDDFLGAPRAASIAQAFPPPDRPGWKRRDYAEQAGRLSQLQRTNFEGVAFELRWFLAELNTLGFLDFLAALTARRDLIPDPHFTGAGLLATVPGGHLDLHVDFNRDSARHLDRVLSILYYATPRWNAAWGGDLELWDPARERCITRIAPLPDRLVVLAFGEDHWHGHPAPLTCPEGMTRSVVAAHYFAATPSDDSHAHGAIWA